jgi:hypothetical protein
MYSKIVKKIISKAKTKMKIKNLRLQPRSWFGCPSSLSWFPYTLSNCKKIVSKAKKMKKKIITYLISSPVCPGIGLLLMGVTSSSLWFPYKHLIVKKTVSKAKRMKKDNNLPYLETQPRFVLLLVGVRRHHRGFLTSHLIVRKSLVKPEKKIKKKLTWGLEPLSHLAPRSSWRWFGVGGCPSSSLSWC